MTGWRPYYRDLALTLVLGMTPRDHLLSVLAKAEDPNSGGRQMPAHYGSRRHNIISTGSPVTTQLLHAAGIALAFRMRGEDSVCVTAFGEGSTSGGDFHEALNFASTHKLGVVFVVENNGYAISVPVEKQMPTPHVSDRAQAYGIPGVSIDGNDAIACYRAARDAVQRARSGAGPTLLEANVHRLTSHSSDDDQRRYRSAEDLDAERKQDCLPRFRALLEDLGVLVPGDADAMRAELVAELDEADHVRGGGGRPAAGDRHAPRVRGGFLMPSKTYLEAIREGMRDEMRRDQRVMILGEDVGAKGGVFGATEGLQKEFGEMRVMDSPLAESCIVGVCIGAAMNGMRPIAEIQFQDFIMPAVDQIVSEAAKMRYRSNNDWGVPMVVRAPFGGGIHGALYHSQSIEAMFCCCARAQGGGAEHRVRRQGSVDQRDARPRPGDLLRAQARLPLGEGRGARRRVHRAAGDCLSGARGRRHRHLHLRDHGAHRARGCRATGRGRVRVRGGGPALSATARPRSDHRSPRASAAR